MRRLADRHTSPHEIDAIIVSHEHKDHCAGLNALANQYGIPFYLSAGTARALSENFFTDGVSPSGFLRASESFTIRDLSVRPFPVPHDATETLQFVIEDGARRLAILTDLGHVTAAIARLCGDLDMLVLECNYDETLLRKNTKYPEHIIQRIASNYGHLSNSVAAKLIADTAHPRRKNIIAAHLSGENNNCDLVQKALFGADKTATLTVASQTTGTHWITV